MAFVRWTVGAFVFVALLFLSLQNAELVTVRFYHWFSWQAPLIFLLLITFAAGLVAGLLAGLLRTARLKRQLARMGNDLRGAPAAQPRQPVDER